MKRAPTPSPRSPVRTAFVLLVMLCALLAAAPGASLGDLDAVVLLRALFG